MAFSPRLVATQGLFPLTPIAAAVQGLIAGEDEEPTPPPATSGGFTDAPWRWVPFIPVAPRRPRRKRHEEIVLI